jgi:hypothetical protein
MENMCKVLDRIYAANSTERLALIKNQEVLQSVYQALLRALCVCFALENTECGLALKEENSEADHVVVADLTRPYVFVNAFVIGEHPNADNALVDSATRMICMFDMICRSYTSDAIVDMPEILCFPMLLRDFYDAFDNATTRSWLQRSVQALQW